MPDSIESLLASLTGLTVAGPPVRPTYESREATYAVWAGVTLNAGEGLETLVKRKLTIAGIGTGTAQAPQFPAKYAAAQAQGLLQMLLANGASGESVEQCLLRTGLTGWS